MNKSTKRYALAFIVTPAVMLMAALYAAPPCTPDAPVAMQVSITDPSPPAELLRVDAHGAEALYVRAYESAPPGVQRIEVASLGLTAKYEHYLLPITSPTAWARQLDGAPGDDEGTLTPLKQFNGAPPAALAFRLSC